MDRGWYFRFFLVSCVAALALYLLYPSYYYYAEATEEERNDNAKFCAALPKGMPCKKFNLGLDLQGGVHLVMGVQVEKAVEQRADRLAEAMRDSMKEKKLAFSRVDRPRNTATIVLTLAPETDNESVEKFLRKDFSILKVAKRADKVFTLEIIEDEVKGVQDNAVDQAIKTIRNRADKLGVNEPVIARRGASAVLIQLPGVKDPERAIDIIGRTAQLEFKIVDAEATAVFDDVKNEELPQDTKREEYTFDGPGGKRIREVFFELPEGAKEKIIELLTPKIASNREIGFGPVQQAGGQEKVGRLRTFLLYNRPGITGDYLSNAQVQQNPDMPSDYYVTMSFDQKGARIFEKLTEEHVRQHMAIVLDGKVNSAPVIQEKIGGGTARITLGRGGNSQARFQEAKDLTLVLKAGALPAPVEVLEKRQVGRTLGQDAVKNGALAFFVGTLMVLMFMLIYYRQSGVLANMALLLNIPLILAAMAMFEATLSLPGMAGIVLTIGMAVDANVIIFERMREELRIGKTVRAAVDSGYDKAWSTIFDSNVTTLITGVVLMQYGSGPVRGFAVTLNVGILCSMFTAIVATRVVYDLLNAKRALKSLGI
ncbi:MAG: protein translocase subunit SecD [Deltaproteobacteria bacterium]|nr:protein translocase subunit SecD [Deltaproteobacteria bacterium]